MHDVKRTLILEILGFWHPGTGRGDGALADAAVNRSREGLPHLPGRTVKGLLRAATDLGVAAGLVTAAQALSCFGSPPPPAGTEDRVRQLEEGRYRTEPGALKVGSAVLGADEATQRAWARWASQNPSTVQLLYGRLASTRVDRNGVAHDHTLRTIETIVPVTLYATLSGPSDTPWEALDECVRLFLRGLGSRRNRGLGRVAARLTGAP